MSNDNSNVEFQVQDPPSSHRSERMTDALWDQILQAGREAGEGTTSVPVSPRASALPRHAPASLRYLAETAEQIENEVARLSGRGLGIDRHMGLDTEPLLARSESRTRNISQGRLGDDPARQSVDQESRSTDDRIARNESGDTSTEQVDNASRTVEERRQRYQPTRASIPREPSGRPDLIEDEDFRRFLERTRRTSTLQRLERQQEGARVRSSRDIRGSVSSTPAVVENIHSVTPPASNVSLTMPSAPSNSDAVVERSVTARRDLERALRDYRIARRAFRTQHTNDSSPPAEQNTPSYQSVLAQLAEQQAFNRNRLRARGQSRSNDMDLERRTDEIIDRLATATGVTSDTSQTDRPIDRDLMRILRQSISRDTNSLTSLNSQGMRSALPAGVNVTNEAYSIPPARGSNAGMRDFYQRAVENQRVPSRSSVGVVPRVLPSITGVPPESTGIVGLGNRRRYTLLSEGRAEDAIERLNESLGELQVRGREPSAHDISKDKAKTMLKHLSNLKILHNDRDRVTVAIKDLDNDEVNRSLAKGEEVDLPCHISELPVPQYSSWLEDGMSWEGFQKGGLGKKDTTLATGPLFDANENLENRIRILRAWRHRDLIRSERQERVRSQDGQNVRTRSDEETRGLLRGIPNDMESLADIERHLTDLLEEEERRLARDGSTQDEWRASDVSTQARSGAAATVVEKEKSEDKWPVKVTLHNVDWEKKTVQGTMVATQILGRLSSSTAAIDTSTTAENLTTDTEDRKDNGTSMETLFDGEIIDFHNHELETVSDKFGYKVGGPMTDLKYWSRVGPFKEEIKKRLAVAQEKKALETFERLAVAGSFEEQQAEYERTFKDEHGPAGKINKEEEGVIVYNAMAEMLGSRSLLEKIIGEAGWVLMRWKERCFVSEPSSQPPSTSTDNEHTRFRTISSQPATFTTAYTDDQHPNRTAWGLTIRGFYYVAMNRVTGKIDALYFDSGSHPYQQLTCEPTGVRKGEEDVGPIRCDFGTFEFR